MSTICDIAREADVFIDTVSHVLNYPDRVVPLTRERVHHTTQNVAWQPNAAARVLRTGANEPASSPDRETASVPDIMNGYVIHP